MPLVGIAASLLAVALVGCAGPERADTPQQVHHNATAKSTEQPTANVALPASRGEPAASKQTRPPPAQQTAAGQSPANPPPPAPPKERIIGVTPKGSTIMQVGGEEEPPILSDEDLERRREEASDMIYALIRVRMEEAILRRRELLEAGRPRTDVEIRRLEGVIMNARQYLVEDGEVVEAVDPPIVQTVRPK